MGKYDSNKDSWLAWTSSLPTQWQLKPLKHLVGCNSEVLGENTDPTTLIRYIEIGDVSAENGIQEPTIYEFGKAPSRARRIVKSGDVIISTVRTYLKAISSIDDKHDGDIASTGFAVLRPKHIESGYLGYVALADGFIGEIISLSKGVSYPSITAQALTNISIPLPSKEEQAQIAKYIDHKTAQIDDLICKKEKLIELLNEERTAIINQAVTKGLDPMVPMKDSGIEWLGDIPEHWEAVHFKRLAKRVEVGIAEAARHAYVETGGVPILRSTNIKQSKIKGAILRINEEFALKNKSKTLFENDLITVRTGYPGATAVISKELNGCQCFTMLITTLLDGAIPEFYNYLLNSKVGRSYFDLTAWGSAQKNISVPILQYTPVVKLPTTEQIDIVNFLDERTNQIDVTIKKVKRETELLKEYKTTLISEVVTGKVDVRDVEV